MADNVVTVDMEVDLNEFRKGLKESILIAKKNGKILDKETKMKMELNIDEYEQTIKKAKRKRIKDENRKLTKLEFGKQRGSKKIISDNFFPFWLKLGAVFPIIYLTKKIRLKSHHFFPKNQTKIRPLFKKSRLNWRKTS